MIACTLLESLAIAMAGGFCVVIGMLTGGSRR